MTTIIWQKPDGGIAVTAMIAAELERRAWLNENRAQLEQKDALLAEQASLEAADAVTAEARAARETDRETAQRRIGTARDETQIALEDLQREVAGGQVDEAAAAAELARIQADFKARAGLQAAAIELADEAIKVLDAEQLGRNKRHGEIGKLLATIAELEHARDTLGFTHDDYEVILKGRGDIPADHVCVGHELKLPADKTFRGAWVFKDGAIVHDVERARAIHLARLRALRTPMLVALDGQELVASRRGDTAAVNAIRTKKQALCDAPADPAIAAAATVEALKAVWPEGLTK